MDNNTQLPVEVENKLKEQFAYHTYSSGQRIDIKKFVVDMHAAYASKLQEVQQENASLKDWKHSALAILNPLWDYADKHLNVPLGEIKTEAMIKRIKELEHQNDKLKEKATGWRPLLEDILKNDYISEELIQKITKFLYGE